MTDKASQPEAKVTVGSVKQPFFKRKKILVVAGILFVVAGSILYWWLFIDTDMMTGKNVDYGNTRKEVANIAEASKAAEAGDVNASKQAFDKLAQSEKDEQQKAAYYRAQANVCASQQEYSCAIEANNNALKITGDDVTILVANGDYSYAMGNKAQGNEYYGRAIPLLEALNTPESKASAQRLRDIMDGKQLQEQGQ